MKLEQGEKLPQRRIEAVSADRMKAMAALLEDPNPIHLDPAAVAEMGLGDRVINQGPTNLGYALDVVLEAFPSGRIELVDTRYIGTVFAGDTVVAGGEIVNVSDSSSSGMHRVEAAVWVDVDGGRRAIEATAIVEVAR